MAVEVVDEEPDVDRLEFSMLFFRGEAGVGTLGGGSIHSMQTARIKKRAWTMNRRNVPLGVSRVGVALTEDASLDSGDPGAADGEHCLPRTRGGQRRRGCADVNRVVRPVLGHTCNAAHS